MIGQQPRDGERQPAALPSEGARNRMARTIWNMRIASARVLVAFMTMLMVFGTTPAQLWAEGAEGIAQAVDELAATPQVEAAAEDQSAEDAPASDDAAADAEQEPVADEEPAEKAAPEADAAVEQPAAVAPTAVTATGKVNAPAIASADELTSDAKVFIQDTKDKNSSYSTKSGALKAGETLWANVYEGYSSVTNPGSWTYTWLAGTVKASNNVSDYTDVVGNEQSLTVTDAMVGKYFICKVTAGGKDYYGPSVSYGSGINANYIPGPVLGTGQANLYSVKLSSSSPAVGDTLTATPYTAYNTPAASDTKVTYTWYESTNKSSGWTKIEGATSATFTVTEDLAGKYLKVAANAGVNDVDATTYDAVLAKGAVKLTGVQLSAPSTEIGQSLTAKPYTGSSYSPTYVGDDVAVTYTWKYYEGTSAPSSTSSSWEVIDGASGSTFAVDDEKYAGCFFMVEAVAGANKVRSSSVGPFKVQGQVDIYSASLADADTGESGLLFTADATVRARAKEKGVSTFIDSSKLNYQWQESDKQSSNDSDYVDIEGANGDTLALSAYEGKSVRCVVSSKVGKSSHATRGTRPIAAPGSVNVVSVVLDKTGKAYVGDTLTATAKSSGVDVSENERVTWQWYWGESGTANACSNKIEGATSREFTVTDAYKGKYLVARADGGFGGTASSVVGPISVPGSVSLYGVTVSGSPKVGNALTAKATKGNSYTPLDDKDVVSYQWQVSADKSSYDLHFSNIEGATGAKLVLTDDLAGKYVRVVVASENSVKSTEKKSTYGGTSSVDPTGPITLAGQYELKSVGLENANVALTVGTQLTPKAQIPDPNYSWSSKDVPSDAKLTYTWYAKGNADADWTVIADGIDAKTGTLTLGDSLVGKRLKVTAYALDNTEEWISGCAVTAAGTYDLLRVTTTPSASNTATLIAGDTVSAMVQAKRADGSATTGVDVTKNVDIAWYAADSADGDYTAIEGLSGREAVLPESTAGKYLKVVATSGASTIEAKFPNAVLSSTSLDALVAKLDKDFNPAPSLTSADENVNEAMSSFLAQKYGFDNVTVRVLAVDFTTVDANATVGISAENDDTNGDITQFCMDPNLYTGYNWDGLRRAEVIFELSRPGENPVYYDTKKVVVPWDEGALQQLLNDAASGLDVTYAQGDSADSVTSNIEKMPHRAGSANKYVVKWTSSDTDALFVRGQGYNYESGDYTGVVSRKLRDRNVTLTATVSLLNGDASSAAIVGKKAFQVVVKADPEKIDAEKAALQEKVNAAFTYDNIKYSGTDTVANKDGLTDDLQMPRTSTLGVDGKYYKVEYSASTDDVTFNGYKGTVFRPEAGSKDPVSTKLTCTVTDKNNAEVTATKTLDFTVAPQDQADLDNELKLMEAAKAGYAEAILDGQDAAGVTANMHAFQKAYLDADGKLAWSYDKATTDAAGLGIVPVELEGASESAGYRLFKSSRPDLLKHENLVLGETPEYNTKVTVTSRLSSEKYARYAERYPDNPTYAKLANQDVSATVAIKGSTGLDDPNEGKAITVTAQVTGPDTEGNDANWVPQTEVTIPAGETMTAAALTKQVLEQHGMTCDDGMYTISAKDGTLPNGQTSLGSAQDSQGNWRWWVLYINGKQSNLLAVNYYVKAGDKIEWVFGDGSVSALPHTVTFNTGEGSAVDSQVVADGAKAIKPAAPKRDGYEFAGWYADAGLKSPYDFSTSVTKDLTLYAKWVKGSYVVDGVVVDPSAQGPNWDSAWSGFTSADKVTEAPVPTKDAEAKWITALKDPNDYNTYVSDPLLVGDYVYIAVGSKLYKKNVDTGETAEGGEAALVSAIDSTSRMVYVNGLILVPLSSGRLQALTVDSLTTKWVTDALPDGTKSSQQSLSSVTVRDGYAYFGSADADWLNSYGGYLLCVRLSDGQVMWNKANQNSAGYYWSGMAFAGGYGVIADDSGTVSTVDPATGDVVSTLKVADRVRTTVLADGSTLYVTSSDGVLHKLSMAADGTLSEASSVKFGASSTSTPVLANGKIIVGGTSTDGFTGGYQGKDKYHYGQIAVIDAATMKVENVVCKADGNYIRQYGYDAGGDVKSQPVVSVQDGQTYVYFTSNNNPGGIYRYRVGDEEAELLYTPDTANQDYCMSSISVGFDGSLYYTNDSGKLFAIKGNGERLKRFTVTFDANGKDAELPASQRVKQGHPVIEPSAKPTCAGFTFAGWYKDAACTQAWDFAKDVVTADMTLYAKWTKNESPVPSPVPSSRPVSTKGNASSTSLVLTSHATVSLAGVLKSNAARQTGEHESLLAGFDSDELETSVEKSSDRGAVVVTAKKKKVDLPIWPFIGIALGVCVIVLAVLKRKKQGGE